MNNRGLVKNRVGYRALLILIVLLTLITISVSANQLNTIQVSFINVGQGDSALIQDGDGFDVLIDGGRASAGPTVVAYIREQNVDDIEVMVASHADSDHIGGLIEVLNEPDIPVDTVLYNGYPGDTLSWDAFVTAIANEGASLIAAQFPITYTWGSSTAHILNPVPGLTDPESNLLRPLSPLGITRMATLPLRHSSGSWTWVPASGGRMSRGRS